MLSRAKTLTSEQSSVSNLYLVSCLLVSHITFNLVPKTYYLSQYFKELQANS